MLSAKDVMAIHDLILAEEGGLSGDHGMGAVEGALSRVVNHIDYAGMDDVFEIAAMYAVAIARGHVFNDANKRTALVSALAYLDTEGIATAWTMTLETIDAARAMTSCCGLRRLSRCVDSSRHECSCIRPIPPRAKRCWQGLVPSKPWRAPTRIEGLVLDISGSRQAHAIPGTRAASTTEKVCEWQALSQPGANGEAGGCRRCRRR